ncbi:MAG: FtsX-like permease family protein, partial [Ardenticatenaceae bacterium]|nr:FtsX-like permease family protein [Ardenticatenaceae bacterium]
MHSTKGLIWRNLTAHPLRTVLTTLAITLGVAMVLAAAIVGTAVNSSSTSLEAADSPIDLELVARDGGRFDTAVLAPLQSHSHVAQIAPALELTATSPDLTGNTLTVRRCAGQRLQSLASARAARGTFLGKSNSIDLTVSLALANGLYVGDEIRLQVGENTAVFTLAGRLTAQTDLADVGQAQIAFIPLAAAQELAAKPNQIDYAAISLKSGVDAAQAKVELATLLSPDLALVQTAQAGGSEFNVLILQGALAIVGMIILAAAAFVIMNAFAMSVTARSQEIGALRALGMTRRQIMRQVLAEAGALGAGGVLLGVPGGIGLAWLVMTLRQSLGGNELTIPIWGIVLSIALGLLTTLLGALQPAWKASRISPLAAMRRQSTDDEQGHWYIHHGGRIGVIGLIALLVGAAGTAFIWQPDFIAATALLGGAVLGLIIVTILLLSAALTTTAQWTRPFLTRQFGTAGRLAADNLTRNKFRTALTAAALTIGFIAIIGSNAILTASLKSGLEGYGSLFNEDGAIIPDIPALMASGELSLENSLTFITTAANLPPELVTAVTQLDGIQTVRYGFTAVPNELATLAGAPGVFIDPDIFIPLGNFDFFEGDPDSALAMMHDGPAVLLIPITAERLGVGVGDTIPVQTPQGEVVFTVAGIGGTSTNFTVFNYADGEAYFGLTGPSWLGLSVRDGYDVNTELTHVIDLVAAYDKLTVFNMRDAGVGGLVDLVDEVQNLLNALLLLVIIVAALGVVNTMVINISERGREIGLLRAVGATRRQVRQSVMIEAALLGIIAAVIATLFALTELGLFTLVFTPNATESVGIRANWDTARISLLPALRVLGLATLFSFIFGPLVAGLAAYFPARQAAAVNVVEATRSERISLTHVADGRIESHRRKGYWGLGFLLTTRNINHHRLRAIFSAFAVSLGVAMTITADYVSSALLETLSNAGEGSMQITHGFIVEQFDTTIGMVGYVLMGAAAFLIFNAFAMSITERQQQIGALRALGMTRSQIMRLVLLEALLIGGGGTLAGLIIGPLMGQGVVSFMQRFGSEFLAFGDGTVSWGTAVLASIIGLGVTLLSAWIPARRATRVSPLTAMRQSSSQPLTASSQQPAANRQSLISCLLITALFAYLIIAPPGEWIETPWSEALAIGLVLVWLVCLGLLLPLLIRLAGTAVRRGERGQLARLIGDNIQRSRGRVILTILTLAVGLGTITGLTGFMTYAFDDLMGASIRRIAEKGTWAVFPFDLESGIAGLAELDDIALPPEAITAVQNTAGDRASIVPVRFSVVPELSFFGDSYFTYVANPEVVRSNPYFFSFNEGNWETAMPIMQSGCGALVAPLIANRQNVDIGDTLTITTQNGPMECTIAGIGAGYVNASIVGDIVGDELGATDPIGLSITPQKDANTATLEADLQQTIDAIPGVYLTRMSDFAQTQTEALSLFTVALNGMLLLAVVAAALGIVNTTVMSIHERRQELGLLRAVGGTRRQIRQVVMGENALIGLVGAIFGVVAGMGSVVILVTTLGGSSWGVTDLDLWPAAGRALKPTLSNGIVGILAAPLISAWVARWPIRSLLRGSAIATLNPEQQVELDERKPRRDPARHLYILAWRNLQEQRLRAIFSATAVALGVAMIIAAKVTSSGILDSLDEGAGLMTFFIETMDVIFLIIGLVILAAAGFLIFNAFAMTVAQRRQQIGILRSLGMTRRQVLRQIQAEALIVGAAGTLLGLILGPMLGNLTLTAFRQLGVAMGRGNATLGSYVLGMVMGLGITLLSVWVPARQATRVSPLTALRQEMTTAVSHTSRWLTIVGGILAAALWGYLAIAPPGAWSGRYPPLDFVMFGILTIPWLLGVALLLPALIGDVGRLMKRVMGNGRTAAIRLIAENFTRDRRRVTLTILTFAVGLTMINGLNGLLAFSNNVLLVRSAAGSLAQTTWYVYPFDRQSGIAQLDEMNSANGLADDVMADFYALANGRAEVTENYAVTIPEISAPVPGFFSTMNDLRELTRPGLYHFVEGDWETAVPIMEAGCGLLLPPAVANRHEVGVGDTLTLPGKDGPVDCTVAGIGSGGNLPVSRISMAAKDLFDVGNPTALTIWPRPGTDETDFRAELEALADKHGDAAWITDTEEELNAILDTSDQLETMTYAMLALAVVAAALGMVNTTVMSITERRHELGLLRAVGMTRRQAVTIVTGEAALMGLIGGLVGLAAGLGLAFIFGLSYGGISFGLVDLPLWEAVWEIAPTAVNSGIAGMIIAPLVAAAAAYWPSRSVLRGTAMETLNTSYQPDVRREVSGLFSRGSIRTRFVLGTAILMLLVLIGLTATVVRHARNKLEETTIDTVTTMIEFSASMVQFNLPPDAQTLTLEDLQSGNLDAETLLQFRSLIDEMNAFGLTEFVVTDQDNIVLFGFDMGQIGEVLEPLADEERTVTAVTQTDTGQRQIRAAAPIRNANGNLLGSVRLQMELGEIRDFLRDLNRAILLVGGLILALGLALAFWATTPLVRTTRQLAAGAAQVRQGRFSKIALPKRLNVSLRWQLTAVMIILLILLVGALEQVVLPIERRKVEEVTRGTLIAGAEWAAQLLASGIADQQLNLSDISDLTDLFRLMQGANLGQVQDLSEQLQNEAVAYTAVANEDGAIQLSNQFDLIGSEIPLPAQTQFEETEWQGAPIWQVTTPLRDEESGSINGALQMGVLTAPIDDFLAESRTLFQLAGVIAVLAGVILAQAIGGAVAAPVQRLAADTRRVGQGDLSVQFKVKSRDELTQLTGAYNEMVAGLREREWLRDMFGRFVSQEVAEAIRTGQVKLEGENRVVSVLFCDIRGFTARSEKATPAEIVALLNEYLPVVVNAAQQHDGTVNKFGGDSTLIIYGAPKHLQESAYHAVQTALAMRQNLAALNERLAARGE